MKLKQSKEKAKYYLIWFRGGKVSSMTRMTMVAVEDNGGLPWTLVASHQFDFVLGDDFPVQFGPGREAAGASVDGEDARVVLVHLAVEHVGDGAVDALVVVDGHQGGPPECWATCSPTPGSPVSVAHRSCPGS